MKTKKTKEAVSLIVLVLTIVIMIILAGVIITNLSNSGIIGRGKTAVKQMNLKQMQELATAAWGELIIENVDAVIDEDTIKAKLKEMKITEEELDKYIFNVTSGGVKVSILEGWKKEGFKVVRGDQELEIGDVVDYTATGYDGDWKVLGVDDEGNLLIMSAEDVSYAELLTSWGDTVAGQNVWLNGADELDAICAAYDSGEGAIDARSITIEDIDSITGYDKTTFSFFEERYGNEVTYLYNGTTNPATYSEVTGNKTMTGVRSKGLYYYDYDLKKFVNITLEELESGEEGKEIVKLTNTYYFYSVYDVELTKKAELMLFGEYDVTEDLYSSSYWLASICVDAYGTGYSYDMFLVDDGSVDQGISFYYNGYNDGFDGAGVRAVVTLSKDINFTDYTEDEGWIY